MAKLGLYVRLHAKPGKEDALQAFLASALPLAQAEAGTKQWYATRFEDGSFAIFDTFDDESGRHAHLNGPIAAALMSKASELLSQAPKIEQHSLLALKV